MAILRIPYIFHLFLPFFLLLVFTVFSLILKQKLRLK